ncbi:MAG: Tm-1-like ATP-binding domain-containing protein [Saprospiraceae bacterium]|nr:Tm-1-like ATP-binding domain-containing protein [Saprospiraceae bacterium]
MLGCFDSKAEDFEYLYRCLKELGAHVLTVNTGVRPSNINFTIDIRSSEVAEAAGTSLRELLNRGDRGHVIEKMGTGASLVIAMMVKEQRIHGIIGMGGGGGTYICLAGMQEVPFGIPKLCLSTVATKDLSRQVGTKDIVLMPSIVDVAGINSVSGLLIRQAAGALMGMISVEAERFKSSRITVGISMFGNTTECVDRCTELLKSQGLEVLAFHAVGIGGQTMEALIRDGRIHAVLDITTTELADELCEGICSAGPKRLTAAGDMGITQVVVPGCLDMVNYGHLDTVPDRFRSRQLYSWAPDVTLMRTNAEENQLLAKEISEKLNNAQGPVALMLPLEGVSLVSKKGGVFYQPEVDQILFDGLKSGANEQIRIEEIRANINDKVFADKAVEILLELLN